jgi:hypothetical protein
MNPKKAARQAQTRIEVAIKANKVLLLFDQSVTWLEMTPEAAVKLATLMIEHARYVAKEAGIPLEIIL